MALRILYQDQWLVAVDKPAGFHVHPPEDPRHRIPSHLSCMHILRDQLGQYVYPVHRLDRATSGVLLFALDSETAQRMCRKFEERLVQKAYIAVVRGWLEAPLEVDHPLDDKEAQTFFEPLGCAELPVANRRYTTSRYSLIRAFPKSGRNHQIRRHLVSVSHPILGDIQHGSGEHNRIFRDHLGISRLLLSASQLSFDHPQTEEPIRLGARWTPPWHQLFELFGVCPLGHSLRPLNVSSASTATFS